MPRAKQRTPELRDHVLQVAVARLASDGVTGFTTRKVAEEADTRPRPCTSCSATRPGWSARCSSRASGCCGAASTTSSESDDPRADLDSHRRRSFRAFVNENPALADVMFSRPFADFDPGPARPLGRQFR